MYKEMGRRCYFIAATQMAKASLIIPHPFQLLIVIVMLRYPHRLVSTTSASDALDEPGLLTETVDSIEDCPSIVRAL
jgi:hypothetical protein